MKRGETPEEGRENVTLVRLLVSLAGIICIALFTQQDGSESPGGDERRGTGGGDAALLEGRFFDRQSSRSTVGQACSDTFGPWCAGTLGPW